jgi:pimeloyl-ACP methyl ester carboxylesterase
MSTSRASQPSGTETRNTGGPAVSADEPAGADRFRRSEIATSQGPISYRERGEGHPVVFVHGLLVNGHLWDGPASRLGEGLRAIVPDWPMGSHQLPMDPEADLSPPGMAAIIAEFLEELDLDDVTIVGNDSGGAMSQILAANLPERVGRLVLTNCDSFEHFPPFPFNGMTLLARVPGGMSLIATPSRIGAIRRRIYKPLAAERIDPALVDSWVAPSGTIDGIRHDLRKVTASLDKCHTLAAAERLKTYDRPVLLAWGEDDRFFKPAHAERLAATIPGARIEWIAGAKTFVSLDRPERLAELIREFASS